MRIDITLYPPASAPVYYRNISDFKDIYNIRHSPISFDTSSGDRIGTNLPWVVVRISEGDDTKGDL